MTVKDAYKYGIENLKKIYPESESDAIIKLVLEHIRNTDKSKPFLILTDNFSEDEEKSFFDLIKELKSLRPVQYVLGEAWFFNQLFFVSENVLIPRPETEELVQWVIEENKLKDSSLQILDIGTGSGCIPITLKMNLPNATIYSCDISVEALKVAEKNAAHFNTSIELLQLNFLDKKQQALLPVLDIIISNPPYVPEQNSHTMHANVLQYEPAIALFVPDDDPLIFYSAIAEFGKNHLSETGAIYAEIHEDLGKATRELFQSTGYSVTLKKDMQGKDRMIKAFVSGTFKGV